MIRELRHIHAFLAVARCGSFTRAAAELRVSQPALTVQVRQLEAQLGVSLFDRNKRRVALRRRDATSSRRSSRSSSISSRSSRTPVTSSSIAAAS
jgi:Bacterial regulatory helix-turn-helix protein, lysR family